MGKVLEFPTRYQGEGLDRSKVRVKSLNDRLAVIEQRIANYQDDMNFLSSCMQEDDHELSEILKELAQIQGFEEELCE